MPLSSNTFCSRVAVTLCLLVPAVVVPVLEANATHLFNALWPPHARLHEAWQLLTNSALSITAIAWTWTNRRRPACLVGMLLTGGFVAAWLGRHIYGGGMDGTATAATTILGMDLAAVVMVACFLVFLVDWIRLRLPPAA